MAGPFLVFFGTSSPSDGRAFAPLLHIAVCLGVLLCFPFFPQPLRDAHQIAPNFRQRKARGGSLTVPAAKEEGRPTPETTSARTLPPAAAAPPPGAAREPLGTAGGGSRDPAPLPVPLPGPARHGTAHSPRRFSPGWRWGTAESLEVAAAAPPGMSGGGTGRDAAGERGQAGGVGGTGGTRLRPARLREGGSFPGKQRPERCRRERVEVWGKKGEILVGAGCRFAVFPERLPERNVKGMLSLQGTAEILGCERPCSRRFAAPR